VCRWLIAFVLGCTPLPGLAGAAELSDPTRPPDVMPTALTGDSGEESLFVLSSILISPNRRVAIVNGTRVSQGDEVAGAEVVEINASGVQLKADGEVFELRMTKSVKTAVSSRQGVKP
jgi:MSHA biogenesis protein MshK